MVARRGGGGGGGAWLPVGGPSEAGWRAKMRGVRNPHARATEAPRPGSLLVCNCGALMPIEHSRCHQNSRTGIEHQVPVPVCDERIETPTRVSGQLRILGIPASRNSPHLNCTHCPGPPMPAPAPYAFPAGTRGLLMAIPCPIQRTALFRAPP